MQAVNHVVFGSLIAVTINQPLIAIPAALASHFIMDALPHYGEDPRAPRGSKYYLIRILADATASTLVVLYFISLHPPNVGLLITCAIVAVLPDFLWPLALFIKRSGPLWAFFKFHKLIQRESPNGIFLELGWFVATTSLVLYKLK